MKAVEQRRIDLENALKDKIQARQALADQVRQRMLFSWSPHSSLSSTVLILRFNACPNVCLVYFLLPSQVKPSSLLPRTLLMPRQTNVWNRLRPSISSSWRAHGYLLLTQLSNKQHLVASHIAVSYSFFFIVAVRDTFVCWIDKYLRSAVSGVRVRAEEQGDMVMLLLRTRGDLEDDLRTTKRRVSQYTVPIERHSPSFMLADEMNRCITWT